MPRHFASCVSARFDRSSKTSYIAFVGAKSAPPTDMARPPILIQLGRVVERVLAALRLHLDELLLHRGELRLQRARTSTHASAGASLSALLPSFDLRAQRANPVDRVMYLGELVADAHAQSELRVEVRLGLRHARILADLERGLWG